MGISSRRPISISSDKTSLLTWERMEKFSSGPSMPRPGPTLLMHVSGAVNDSVKPRLSQLTTSVPASPDEDEAHEKHARRGDDPLIDGTALRLDDADVVRMDQAVHLAVQALGQQRDARDLDAAGGRPGARTREHQRRQHDLTRRGPEGEVLRGIAGGGDDGDDLKGRSR